MGASRCVSKGLGLILVLLHFMGPGSWAADPESSKAGRAPAPLPSESSANPAEVTKAYFEDGGQAESVTLVILLERPVEPRIYSLAAPPRLVVDLHNAHAHMMLPNEISPRTDSLIKGVRIGEHENEGFVRFVCDLWDDEQYSVTPRLRILEGGSPGAELRVTVARTESQSR